MNLIDAIKSGKKFRRPQMPWLEVRGRCFEHREGYTYQPDPQDIMADDWEVEEPTAWVSKRALDEALMSIVDEWDLAAPNQKTKPLGDPVVTWERLAQTLWIRFLPPDSLRRPW